MLSVQWRRFLSAVVFCALFITVAGSLSKLHPDRYMNTLDEETDYPYEGLWVGSSHIYRTIIPQMLYDEYGLAMLSESTPGQTSYHTLAILEDYAHWDDLKLVVLDVFAFLRPYTYSDDFNHSLSTTQPELLSGETRQNRLTASSAVLRQMPEYDMRKYIRLAQGLEMPIPLQYSFAVVNSHSQFLRMHRSNYESADTRITRNKNYDISTYMWPLDDPFTEDITPDESVHLNAQCEEYLLRIIELCQSKNVPLLMTAIPYDVCNAERIVLDEIACIAEEHGVDYISMETVVEEAAIDWGGDFMDHGHTNYYGAAKITSFFGYYISSYYEMTDRNGDDLPDSPFLDNAYGYFAEETMLINDAYPMKDYLESLYNLDDSYLLLFSTGASRGADLTESQRDLLENLGFSIPEEENFDLMQINEGFEMLFQSADANAPVLASIDGHTFRLDCKADNPVFVNHEAVAVESSNSRLLVFDRCNHEVIDSVAFSVQDDESVVR